MREKWQNAKGPPAIWLLCLALVLDAGSNVWLSQTAQRVARSHAPGGSARPCGCTSRELKRDATAVPLRTQETIRMFLKIRDLSGGLPLSFHFTWLQNQWHHFGVGEFTTHFRTYFSGWIESDVHWGYDLAFDPWPHVFRRPCLERTRCDGFNVCPRSGRVRDFPGSHLQLIPRGYV